MTKHNKTPLEPLHTLKGTGYVQAKRSEAPRSPTGGEKALLALDTMVTDGMRRDGLLPPGAQQPQPQPASPPPNIEDFDPSQLPMWTLMMALAWIETRSLEAVTWQRDDWRRENGLPETSYAVSALTEFEPDDEHPIFFDTSRAFTAFRRYCEAAKLVAFGMSAAKGEPVPMRPTDWAYGRMELSSKLDEVWRVGGDSFSRIMVEQSQLLACTAETDASSAEKPTSAGPAAEPSVPEKLALLLQAPRGSKTKAILAAAWEIWKGPAPFYASIDRRDDDLFAAMKNLNEGYRDTDRPDRETFRTAMEKYDGAISRETPRG